MSSLAKALNQEIALEIIEGISFRKQGKQIVTNPQPHSQIAFTDLPLPAYDLLPSFEPYYIFTPLLRPYALVYAGKGCPYGCAYCNVAGTKYSGRSAQSIIEELRLLKKLGNIKYVWFYDEIFTINRAKMIKICNAMIKEQLKIRWFCDSRVDLVDGEMLRLMRKAGCIGIAYGIESGSQKILDSMKKGITVEHARKSLLMTRKAKIPFQLNLIIGYLGENRETLRETESFIREMLPDTLQVTKMMALEGTEFMELALQHHWVKVDLDWKTRLKERRLKLKDYPPFKLKLYKTMMKLQRLLYYNPKWWLNTLRTLIYNPILIIPTVLIFLRMIKSRRLFSGIIT
jgi:anaerobic magnesium-protoporphyrin IX monomethyl ester cyclase